MDSERDSIDEGLAERLRAFGRRPVDPAVRSAHLTSIAEVSTSRRRWASPLRVGAAAVVGFLVGTTGLAGAGALPDSIQQAASDALDKVGINVPEGSDVGTKRIRSAECTALAGGDDYKNHGQFLKAVRENGGDLEAAKALDCGKPVASLEEELGDAAVEDSTVDDAPDSERGDKGRPDSPGASEGKGRAPEGAGTGAECAGGADNATPVDGAEVAASAPPDSPPGMPDCAADQKPDEPGAAADATGEEDEGDVRSGPPASSKAPTDAGDVADEKAKDTPAADRPAPAAGDTSSAEGS